MLAIVPSDAPRPCRAAGPGPGARGRRPERPAPRCPPRPRPRAARRASGCRRRAAPPSSAGPPGSTSAAAIQRSSATTASISPVPERKLMRRTLGSRAFSMLTDGRLTGRYAIVAHGVNTDAPMNDPVTDRAFRPHRAGAARPDRPAVSRASGSVARPSAACSPRSARTRRRRPLAHAWDIGIRYFDTAPLYGYGLSERRHRAPRLRAGDRATRSCCRRRSAGSSGRPSDPGRRRRRPPGVRRSRTTPSTRRPGRSRPVFDYSARRRPPVDRGEPGADSASSASTSRSSTTRTTTGRPRSRAPTRPSHRLREEGIVGAIGAGMNQSAMLARFAREGDLDVFLLAGRYTLLDQEALPGAAAAVRRAGDRDRPGRRDEQRHPRRPPARQPVRLPAAPTRPSWTGPAGSRRSARATASRSRPRRSSSRSPIRRWPRSWPACAGSPTSTTTRR